MKALELAIKAGRLRQSPLTHFVHHCPDNPDVAREVIPIYENFCFVLALLRTKTSDNMLEGKALLEKLFAFQTAEGFPIYLHEYPHCHSRRLAQKLSLIAHFILKDFSSILGEPLRKRLETLATPLNCKPDPQTPEEWAEFLIQNDCPEIFPPWDLKAFCFTALQRQELYEPEVTLLDLIVGELTGCYSQRVLRDHPVHLQASLIYPRQLSCTPSSQKSWSRKFWGDSHCTHSAVLQTQGIIHEHGSTIQVELPSKDVHDEVEISYYLNRDSATSISINGRKATTFQLGQPVRIESGPEKFEIVVSLQEGSGRFWGHLYFGNRSGQIGNRGSLKYEAFDWHIALRTAERKEKCLIEIEFRPFS